MTARQRRELNRARAARRASRLSLELEFRVREIARDLDDVDSRLGLTEGEVEQLKTDVTNLESEIDG